MTYSYSSLFGDEIPTQKQESAPTQAATPTQDNPKPTAQASKGPADYLAYAEALHKDMSRYGNLGSHKKALVASALCLYLWGVEEGIVMESAHESIGRYIYNSVRDILDDLDIPESLLILSQISVVKDVAAFSDPKYGKDGKAPLQMFLDSFKNNGIYEAIKDSSCPDDILGKFYGDFTSGEVGDGKSLGDVFNMENGKIPSSHNTHNGEFPFITAAKDWSRYSTFSHDCEGIAMALRSSGSLGRTHYINGKVAISNLCVLLTVKPEYSGRVIPKFYNEYFSHIRTSIAAMGKGATKKTISLEDLSSFPIRLFPMSKQEYIIRDVIDVREDALRIVKECTATLERETGE